MGVCAAVAAAAAAAAGGTGVGSPHGVREAQLLAEQQVAVRVGLGVRVCVVLPRPMTHSVRRGMGVYDDWPVSSGGARGAVNSEGAVRFCGWPTGRPLSPAATRSAVGGWQRNALLVPCSNGRMRC